MTDKEYATFVNVKLLNLREGDALSVNTEEITFSFAREIANSALEITHCPVKIVVTDNGRPVEVADFEPKGIAVQIKAMAMVRISSVTKEIELNEPSLNVVVDKDDLITCQKHNHLAEPIDLERRIAVPYCVVPYCFNNNEMKAQVEKAVNDFDSISAVVQFRKQNLLQKDIHTLHFISEFTDFTLDLPENVGFISNLNILSNGRKFNHSIETESIITDVDKNSLNGKFEAKCKVFGKNGIYKFEAENGVIHCLNPSFELKQLLSFDSDINKAGYLKFSDKRFSLFLGGAPIEPVLQDVNDNKVPDYLNTCIYALELVLDDKMSIISTDCEGKESEIVRKGFFLD